LGLDLGTTNVKAVVVDRSGRICAESAAPVDRFCTTDGGVEQDIEAIWQGVCGTVRQAAEGTEIEAVGVSSQGAAMQLLNEQDRPVGRVVSWLDGRGRPFDRQLTDELGESFFTRHAGRAPSTMTPGQIIRLKTQAPELWCKARRIGYVGDVIVGRLCGRRAHDPTSLSIAMLYNPWQERPDPDLLGRLGLREDQLPDLIAATTPAGRLSRQAANETGLRAGIPVSAAIHDQYAASVGAGSVEDGDVCLGTGTAWALVANTGRLAEPVTRGTFTCQHPVPGLFGQMLAMTNGGSALDWVLNLLGRPGLSRRQVDEALEAVAPGSEGLVFWPLLTPSAEAERSLGGGGRITGMTLAHLPNDFIRAVVEGLACELARHLRFITDAGFAIGRLILCGGAATSRVTSQILADVTLRPVVCMDHAAPSALGAAVIARALVEPGEGLASLARRLAPQGRTLEPGPDAVTYMRLLQKYLEPFREMCL